MCVNVRACVRVYACVCAYVCGVCVGEGGGARKGVAILKEGRTDGGRE